MQSLDTIHDYLALCGAPHNARYVAMSVMLWWFTGTSLKGISPSRSGHIKLSLFSTAPGRVFSKGYLFGFASTLQERRL